MTSAGAALATVDAVAAWHGNARACACRRDAPGLERHYHQPRHDPHRRCICRTCLHPRSSLDASWPIGTANAVLRPPTRENTRRPSAGHDRHTQSQLRRHVHTCARGIVARARMRTQEWSLASSDLSYSSATPSEANTPRAGEYAYACLLLRADTSVGVRKRAPMRPSLRWQNVCPAVSSMGTWRDWPRCCAERGQG